MKIIAHIRSEFPEKFGIPRQSGLVPETRARIIFEREYRRPEAFRGIEQYSHLWLIWSFSKSVREEWSPTVRPPRLGGNTRVGVFATRSPFRPNPIGLSCVTLEEIEFSEKDGPVLIVGGADLLDGTPIYDIKPYLPYVDAHPEAKGGFSQEHAEDRLTVRCEASLWEKVPPEKRDGLEGLLSQDPRPAYQNDEGRIYGMLYGDMNVHFTVSGRILTVTGIEKTNGL